MDDSITLKGIKQGLLISVKPDGKWSDMSSRLTSLIDAQGTFFNGAQVTLALGTREIRRGELVNLRKQLDKRNVSLIAVLSDSAAMNETTRRAGLKTDLGVVDTASQVLSASHALDDTLPARPPTIDPEERGTDGVLIRRTLRNGRTVHSNGHVVILGDVNAGAVVIAEGDVVVWGRLRGTVHAGASGDESAVVCALDLAPTQLRIAGHITISPEDKRRKPRAEKALVRNGRIEAEAWY